MKDGGIVLFHDIAERDPSFVVERQARLEEMPAELDRI